MRSVDIKNAPRGPIKFDSRSNPIENVYIRRTENVKGKPANVVIKTYPDVSQFWTFKPEAFLNHPVFSRTYPECNACK